VEKVLRYNARLRETLDKALSSITTADPRVESLGHGRLFDVAIEHRLMHVETLCYMLHQLPLERKLVRRVLRLPQPDHMLPAKSTFPLESRRWGCRATPEGQPGPFGWDNEFEENRVDVPAFAIDAYNVTNKEYLRFVHEGGYSNRSLWSDAGWEYISSQGRTYPIFWEHQGDSCTAGQCSTKFRCRPTGRST